MTDPNSATQPEGEVGGGNVSGAAAPQQGENQNQSEAQANPNGAAAQAAAAAEAAANKPWYGDLPEAAHEALKGFGSFDEALTAMKRGQEFAAPKGVEDLKLTLPEGTQGDASLLDPFKEFCVKQGIPARQAQELINWQSKFAAEATADYIAAGENALRERWTGKKYDQNREQALVALSTLDRRMGGRLVPAAKANGMVNDPVVIEALYTISTIISEDSLGGGSPGAGSDKPEDPADHFRALGFK